MKKSGKRPAKSKKGQRQKQTVAAPSEERRSFLRLVGLGATGSLIGVSAAWWGVSSFRAYARETDLTRVGNGTPSVVQVHDPQCSDCTVLQRATRKALDCFEEAELQYLVASLDTGPGRIFATAYSAPRVTLLLFDGAGHLQNVAQGVRNADDLKTMFEAHVATA